jgi:hypothetical protein
MLLFVVRTYDGGPLDVRSTSRTSGRTWDHWTYTLQTVLVDVYGTTGRTLLFEYPLDNTWTYETPYGPMYKDHWTYARVVGHPLLCQRVGGKLSL